MNEEGIVEGKIEIWIKSGKFSHSNDLYVRVDAVSGEDKKRQIWKTDEKDSSSPEWDSTVVKHVKGKYEKLVFSLLDEEICKGPFIGELEMNNADGESIGHIDISVKFEPGDVSMWDLANSRLHDSDSD